jgi:hypothetical protein
LLVTIVASVLLSALVGVAWRHRRRRQLADQEELRGLRGRVARAASATSETPTLDEDSAAPVTSTSSEGRALPSPAAVPHTPRVRWQRAGWHCRPAPVVPRPGQWGGSEPLPRLDADGWCGHQHLGGCRRRF